MSYFLVNLLYFLTYGYSESQIWLCHYSTEKPFILNFKMALKTSSMWAQPYFSSLFCCPNYSLPILTPSWSSWCNLRSIYAQTTHHSQPTPSTFSFFVWMLMQFLLPEVLFSLRWLGERKNEFPSWDYCLPSLISSSQIRIQDYSAYTTTALQGLYLLN